MSSYSLGFHTLIYLWGGAMCCGLGFGWSAANEIHTLDISTLKTSNRPQGAAFRIGGVNSNEVIRSLTELNGISIRVLEARMRPGNEFNRLSEEVRRDIGSFNLSNGGFLGRTESLLEVLARDNTFVVTTRRLTHQRLAAPLIEFMRLWRDGQRRGENFRPIIVTYPPAGPGVRPRRFDINMSCTRGYQASPFSDEAQMQHQDTQNARDCYQGAWQTAGGCSLHITNLDTRKTLTTFDMIPFLIHRYGFYEGMGTPVGYRLPPEKILEVLDFLN